MVYNNPDWNTGPIAHPLARSLAPLTGLFAPHCSLCLDALLRSLVLSLAHFAYLLVGQWMIRWLFFLSFFYIFWTIMHWLFCRSNIALFSLICSKWWLSLNASRALKSCLKVINWTWSKGLSSKFGWWDWRLWLTWNPTLWHFKMAPHLPEKCSLSWWSMRRLSNTSSVSETGKVDFPSSIFHWFVNEKMGVF